jgi:methyltransferase
MSFLYAVLSLVALQRLAELAYSNANTKRLLRLGATETGALQYPFFVALHAAWLLTMAFTISADARPNILLLCSFALLQALRLWIILSLGPYWTIRVITPPRPLVTSGPYRYVRHPNYAVVIVEIALLPLAFGAITLALVFSMLNAALLVWRINTEDRALEARRLTEAL